MQRYLGKIVIKSSCCCKKKKSKKHLWKSVQLSHCLPLLETLWRPLTGSNVKIFHQHFWILFSMTFLYNYFHITQNWETKTATGVTGPWAHAHQRPKFSSLALLTTHCSQLTHMTTPSHTEGCWILFGLSSVPHKEKVGLGKKKILPPRVSVNSK